ncbi:sel1 repeat family protein [Acetobacter estunensis]|nr:sel1 repeat family protein [Acetobacter estunensis]MBV1835972.1 sel1 repeat family protein [Acetobacter estunensis]
MLQMKTQDDVSGLSLSVESFLALGQISLNQGNLGQAFIMFEAAARSGDVRAVNMLGRAFAMGWGTVRNPVMAAQCFQVAARAGYGWAMFNLADLYMQQSALERNIHRAAELYFSAARLGVTKALNMLGLLYEEGLEGTPDTAMAFRLFQMAAEVGDCWGCLNLGRLYLERKQFEQAAFWLDHAISMGFDDVYRGVALLVGEASCHVALKKVLERVQCLLCE